MFDREKAGIVYGPGRARYCIGDKAYTHSGVEIPLSVLEEDARRIEAGEELEPDEAVLPALKRPPVSEDAPQIAVVAAAAASPHNDRVNGTPETPPQTPPKTKSHVDLSGLHIKRLRAMASMLCDLKGVEYPWLPKGEAEKPALIGWIEANTD